MIVFGGAIFGIIALLDYRPQTIIYHAYEQVEDLPAEEKMAHKLFLPDVDLVITPEIRRLIRDCQHLDVWPQSICEIYNVADNEYPKGIEHVSIDEKRLNFFWAGSLSRKQTFANYFFSDHAASFKFEMYGRKAESDSKFFEEKLKMVSNVKHYGIVSGQTLNRQRALSAYAVMWWNPLFSSGHYYLASNRFFTAIQALTPPICGPHPQCLEIQEKYGCAIIMEDWTEQAMYKAMKYATDIFDTPAYRELVQQCSIATQTELNWSSQFEKIWSSLPSSVRTLEVA